LLAIGTLACAVGAAGCQRGSIPEEASRTAPTPKEKGGSFGGGAPGKSTPEPSDPISALKQESFDVARQLIADLPDAPESVAVLALVQDRYGRSEEALESWQRCLELDSRFASAYHGMGTIVQKRGDAEEAVRLFRTARSLDPTLRDCNEDLADALMNQGEFQEATLVLEDGLAAGVRTAGAYFRLGQAYMQRKQFESARKNFHASIDVDPEAYSSYYGLANAYARLGQREESKNILKQFSKLKKKSRATETERLRSFDDIQSARESAAFFHHAAAQIYENRGDLHPAEKHLTRAVSLVPANTGNQAKLAQLYQRQKRWMDAIKVLERLCLAEPEDISVRMNLGNVRMLAQRFDAAEADFRQVCQTAPDFSQGYSSLAQLLVRRNRKLDEANTLAEKAVQLEPIANNYFVLSLARASNGDRSGALAAIENALRQTPDNPAFRQLYESLQEPP